MDGLAIPTSDPLYRLAALRAAQFTSLITFTKTFYKLRTGRDFNITYPDGRESHYISIANALERVARGECRRLIINVPPRYGKTELAIHFIAWMLARYPDSNFIYVSYAHMLAKKQTQTIRDIIALPEYKTMFNIELSEDSTAKDNFETKQGGSIYGTGAGGTITGRGAGIKFTDRFGGCVVIDDIHKPDEVTSDTIRNGVNEWYYETLQSRVNSMATPIIFIGQRLHEDDLAARLIATGEWEQIILPALDIHEHPLAPDMHDVHALRKMALDMPYVFAAQYQQDPQPAGGGIFKTEWFVKLEEEPHILTTFLTVDTAETDKDYNDASVFSFWGLYKIMQDGTETDIYGLHWLDCQELRVEPKDLKPAFMQFYHRCMRHRTRPDMVAIERKSTGTTLLSCLTEIQGIQTIDITRTKASGSKTQRFLEAQPYVSTRRISLPEYGTHTNMCIEHCRKITANNSHRHDDIADTLYDAIKLALIDNIVVAKLKRGDRRDIARKVMSRFLNVQKLKERVYGANSRTVY